MVGGEGNDRLFRVEAPGPVTMIGGPGQDELRNYLFATGWYGEPDVRSVYPGFADVLRGGQGDDKLWGDDDGLDECDGGPGIDIAQGCGITIGVP